MLVDVGTLHLHSGGLCSCDRESTRRQRRLQYLCCPLLDLFMAILWLASMGANAAQRAAFNVPVNASCYNDGSAVNSGHCVVSRREGIFSRAAVATQAGLAQISAIAGLSALQSVSIWPSPRLLPGPMVPAGMSWSSMGPESRHADNAAPSPQNSPRRRPRLQRPHLPYALPEQVQGRERHQLPRRGDGRHPPDCCPSAPPIQ